MTSPGNHDQKPHHPPARFEALFEELVVQAEIQTERMIAARDKAREFLTALNTAIEVSSKK